MAKYFPYLFIEQQQLVIFIDMQLEDKIIFGLKVYIFKEMPLFLMTHLSLN